ncbi:MAG: hypothetical protein Q3M30_02870 [Candidatus Electrothrix sp. Rat3]|nr:hypothetical protein [Candidatus Electrothrix rattekaaiensis]
MKKITIFLTLTATAILLGGCYFPPPPYQPGVARPAAPVVRPIRPYHRPVMVPAPRVVIPLPPPPPVYYYR